MSATSQPMGYPDVPIPEWLTVPAHNPGHVVYAKLPNQVMPFAHQYLRLLNQFLAPIGSSAVLLRNRLLLQPATLNQALTVGWRSRFIRPLHYQPLDCANEALGQVLHSEGIYCMLAEQGSAYATVTLDARAASTHFALNIEANIPGLSTKNAYQSLATSNVPFVAALQEDGVVVINHDGVRPEAYIDAVLTWVERYLNIYSYVHHIPGIKVGYAVIQ